MEMGLVKEREVVFISGGSRGIGAATAVKLAQSGFDIAIGFRTAQSDAQRVIQECKTYGVRAVAVQMDVCRKEDVERGMRAIKWEMGSLPMVLIHCAGISRVGLIQDVTEEEYEEMMNVHVRGAIYLIQQVVNDMIRNQYGRIILLSSIWAEAGGAGEVLYSTAKGAINGLVRSLAKELAPSAITVNAVAPGAIATDMVTNHLNDVEQHMLAEEIPLGRLGEANEVAEMIAYLCERRAGYVTGQVLHINGGWYP
ncbi:elongation factor P 5-aminopentanone reductase [Mechercharimyces sp. CAU 1602]|uniref:elongation factor P 5-aminopentanone reductase n=1 Tax=Mechercharimyces sp. CAU 1602 TaxID=2973933 RepID=UPI002161B0D7|nr:SDR family oxidoreductase [Mechercharimyces sp. CAU 1602]MCS1351243.1 SDR family oxidoreductase [Mechercharimyces sp. CAU 1602]